MNKDDEVQVIHISLHLKADRNSVEVAEAIADKLGILIGPQIIGHENLVVDGVEKGTVEYIYGVRL